MTKEHKPQNTLTELLMVLCKEYNINLSKLDKYQKFINEAMILSYNMGKSLYQAELTQLTGVFTGRIKLAEQSVEELAYKYGQSIGFKTNAPGYSEFGFIAGANYILNKKGLVSKDRVCEIIRNWYFRDKSNDTARTNEVTDMLN